MDRIFRQLLLQCLFFLLLIMCAYCSDSFAQSLLTPPVVRRHYIPTIDFAQYALHQGDVRSANLIEGFIPLYQSTLSTLSFADIRFYNPNGTPIEGNIDLGFRRLFHQNSRLGQRHQLDGRPSFHFWFVTSFQSNRRCCAAYG